MKPTRTIVTLTDATAALTGDDIATMNTVVAATGATAAYTLPSGIYIGFTNSDGETVAYLYPSLTNATVTSRAATIPTWLPGRPTRADLEPGGYDVFLARGIREAGAAAASLAVVARYGAPCDTCWTATPRATGICESCY